MHHITELRAADYFFTLALLSISFVGFGAIVTALRQSTTGKSLSKFHVMLTRVFIELGLMAATFALLPSTLALGGMSEEVIWRTTSAAMIVVLLPWLVFYPIRRHAAKRGAYPARVYVMLGLGSAALMLLAVNVAGLMGGTSAALPFAIGVLYILSFASVAFLATYNAFLRD